MSELEAIILGLIQGLTEFLPVSSSGHLTIGKELFGIEVGENLSFEIAVHTATVLSTIVAFRKEIWDLLKGFLKFKYNSQTEYILKIGVSMIPVFVVGVFFKDFIEGVFGSGLLIVGLMLLLTAFILFLSEILSKRFEKKQVKGKEVGYKEAFIMGLAQSVAVMPGLSRSGSTIATGLMCGVKKDSVAQFSFLMVLVPILGQSFLELVGGGFSVASSGISALPMALGFISAFVSGFIACKWMIQIVRKAKLTYFSIYCLIAGAAAIIYSVL